MVYFFNALIHTSITTLRAPRFPKAAYFPIIQRTEGEYDPPKAETLSGPLSSYDQVYKK